ncbi:Acetoin:2,6-dichlorophenolindophenol oxidoreductase subunit alpha [Bremerella volcania]|uniref:Acetoin:2,6-dichlorophenolindophenol oxidoreductase subunit alpha n=1 Tax=Bremerella volcania TaxID=2527984 RepID=A0A518C5T9_9BACT|nr:thiamine pyrophosphate-dependent enzyme [Bremerella volcania]QDU74589.1 Acetoin:2,6-dichlorophenolindophenol oxidoreductase subunit alpha [Bremerella volcania]
MDRDTLRAFLRDMLLARAFEEAAAEQYTKGNIAGFLHLYPGEEAVAVGVIHATEPADYVVSTYREHVHALVRGTPPRQVMAELFGRRDGISRGMGGSMHLFDRERRFMGGYAIVGETYPVAIGVGYAIAMRDLPEVAICFFGDGAVNQGTFHESLNMAALWRLPVLFVCENNHYQIGTEIHRHSAVTEVFRRAAAYNIPAERVDGMDVFKVHEVTSRMLREIRSGGGPRFVECETYRLRGHSMADPGSYRPQIEVRAYASTDPVSAAISEAVPAYPSREQLAGVGRDAIDHVTEHGLGAGHLDPAEVDGIKSEVQQLVQEAVEFAKQSPDPEMAEAWRCLHVNRRNESLI